MTDAPSSGFSTDSIAHLYKWDEIEAWRLLKRHFELSTEGFSFVVVFAPDEWAVALLREHLPQMLPEPGAIERVRFDPAAGPDSLAQSLLAFVPPATGLRVVWIDADPAEPDKIGEQDKIWDQALAKLNRYRNTLQKKFACTLALALPSRMEQLVRAAAPDIWSIRSGVFRVEPSGASREGISRLPMEDRFALDRTESGDSGDPAVTLTEADKLRGKPGRELLLATLLQRAGNQARRRLDWATAEKCLQEAYSLQSAAGGDPELKWDIATDLANVFVDVARYDRAEYYLRLALQTAEEHFGPSGQQTCVALNNLAQVLHATNRLAEAEPLLRRALAIDEQSYGPQHPQVTRDLNNLAQLLQDTNRLAEAEPLMRRALAIDEQSYGPQHPHVARDLNNLAALLQATNRLAEAEPLMRRALAIDEQSYGAQHPHVASNLNNLAVLLQATNRLAEAEPLMRRALAIDEQSYGPQHPNVAIRLNNLAQLLQATNRLADAEPLMRRCLEITRRFRESTGYEHPNSVSRIENYRQLLEAMKLSKGEIAKRLAPFV